MCGIAGILDSRGAVSAELIRVMTSRIIPRGPDSSGEWIDDNNSIGLGHRRLAILDLTAAGHQPMASVCGRYVISYNGEIYNFAEIRAALEASGKAPPWRGHSDTEVLLAAIAAWGVAPALKRFSGMFAFALWDRERRELTLARDRFGEKPLYYGWCDAGFVFASTLGPIRALPRFANPVSPAAMACLMARAHVAAPLSIHSGIFKLPPGCILAISADADRAPRNAPPQEGRKEGGVLLERWFDYADEVLAGAADPLADHAKALDALDAALTGAVGRQLVADVPVGTFLSGGIDSSLVTAIAQRGAARPIRSFTIGFAEAGYDEAVHAKQVAAAIGTDHTELYVTARDAQDLIPSLPALFDEPFADSSQLPTHLVARLARTHVTVALSGDGGDELFGGYNRHTQIPGLWRAMQRLPGGLRSIALNGAACVPPSLWNGLSDLAGRRRSAQFGANARRGLQTMARARSFDGLLDSFLDDWALHPSPLTAGMAGKPRLAADPRLSALPLELQMMHVDTCAYLPDDILTKVDRAAMGVSLETRIPFLDPAVTSVAARIVPALKFGKSAVSGGQAGKQILQDLLARYIPRSLFDRPKAGFSIPVGLWLHGPLRDWAEDLLSPAALGDDGLFDVPVVRARWQAHLSGQEEATQPLWSILMYQAWKRGASA